VGSHKAVKPRAQEVRDELDRVLAFGDMQSSPQQSSFLRFVVEEALASRGDRIKERTVALGALDRDRDFDPRVDAIVRIVAGKLRRTMDRYYASDGTSNPLRILIPKGTYCPVFLRPEDVAKVEAAPQPQADVAVGPMCRTKLHRPPVTSDLVRRTRLLEYLEKHRDRPFTLISAPAGYGKSTLASSWVEADDRPCAWVSLDESDSDLRAFLACVVAAVQTVFPDACRETQVLLEAPAPPQVSVLSRHLLNDLDALDEAFSLVLDDYHRVRGAEVHDLLAEVLAHPPPAMQLVVITRRDPPLPLSTLRGRGQVNEISVRGLRFTAAETATFLKNVSALPIDGAAAAVIEERIEGWPAGLRLAARTLRDPADLDRLLAALKSGFSHIVDYLVTEVVSRQSSGVQDCLLRTSVLDRLCAPLCEALCGPEIEAGGREVDGQEFLIWLQTNNLFLISLDGENRWFRYHHLFQQLLQGQLQSRFSAEEVADLHHRASEWFGENDLIEEAIRHALAAGDTDRAAELVEGNRQALHNADKWYVLEKRLSMLPESVMEQDPGLLLGMAWVRYHRFEVSAIPSIIEAAGGLLGRGPHDRALQGEIDFLQSYCAFFQGKGARSLKHVRNALKQLPPTHHEIRGQAEILYGLASQMEGRDEAALRHLADVTRAGGSAPPVQKTRWLVTSVYVQIIAGRLAEAEVASRRLEDVASAGRCAYALVWSRYLAGLVALLRNDLEEAIQQFSKSVGQRYIQQLRAAVDSMAGLAYAWEALGRPGEADAAAALLSDYAREREDPDSTTVADACRARLALMRGDVESAVQWLRAGGATNPEVMVWWLEVPAVTHCRVLLAEGSDASLDEAETRLRAHLQQNDAQHNTRQMVDILLLLAALCRKTERLDEALDTAARAVELTGRGGLAWPYVEMGGSVAGLLEQLQRQGTGGPIVGQLLSALQSRGFGAQADGAEALPPEVASLLTQRELEVLALLAEGLSNKEAAARLHRSPETVKKHVYNIYRKLDVDSRFSALAQARALGILPQD
jgi:LuxR family maltose regulon positive regulatory protein